MNYAAALKKLRSGDLLAWSHRACQTWYDVQIQIVRIATRSDYNHVGVAWRAAGKLFVLEAVQTGVRIFPLERLLPCFAVPLKAEWLPEVEAWALDQVGEPYSKWQAVLAGLGLLKAGEDNIWQCAEYAQQVAQRLGVPLPGKATPSNLVREAMGRPGAVMFPVTADNNMGGV